MRNIAIIPARSGSKGLKDKNIKLLNGKPLIAYTIEAARESGMFNEIFVSTDSAAYADIAREYGADVPFLRDGTLASDTASSWDVVFNTICKYAEYEQSFDSFTLLQPTSPLRNAEDIVDAYRVMYYKQANAIVGVCEVEHSPLWSNTLPEDCSLVDFLNEEIISLPRQKLAKYYRINGAIYIVKTDYFESTRNIYKSKCYAHIMSKVHSIDIDYELDFMLAEMVMIKESENVQT